MPASSLGISYISVVPLHSFYKFITHNGELRTHFFESNVRSFEGDAKVNREIAKTLETTGGEEFWWLNNGVTIIASKVRSAGEPLIITDPLIVNGLQTSYVIYRHFKKNDAVTDNIMILVRVIQNTDQQSVDKIIKATNSQTEIGKIYLHATESIQRNIESVLQNIGLYYDRRKNYYRNEGKSPSKIVTIDQLAQAVTAMLHQKPSDARAKPTSLTTDDKQYKHIFSDAYPIEMYQKCAALIKRVDDFLDGCEITTGDKTNIIFHVAMYATCLTLKMAKPKPQSIAALVMDDLTDDLLDEAFCDVRDEYDRCGRSNAAAKGSLLTDRLKQALAGKYIRPHAAIRLLQKTK